MKQIRLLYICAAGMAKSQYLQARARILPGGKFTRFAIRTVQDRLHSCPIFEKKIVTGKMCLCGEMQDKDVVISTKKSTS